MSSNYEVFILLGDPIPLVQALLNGGQRSGPNDSPIQITLWHLAALVSLLGDALIPPLWPQLSILQKAEGRRCGMSGRRAGDT